MLPSKLSSQTGYALLIVVSLLGMRNEGEWWPEVQGAKAQSEGEIAQETQLQDEPEIDRTDVWAIKYSRYLYHLAHEIKWPAWELASTTGVEGRPFEIGVVGWDALTDQLTDRYMGRNIAGRPIAIVGLSAEELAERRAGFDMLFLSGDGAQRKLCRDAAQTWKDAGATPQGLTISDAWTDAPEAIDFRRFRSSSDSPPGLCLEVNRAELAALQLALPPIFESRTCP
jgi:hypothetical protein